MNRPLKYFLITLASALLTFCIFIAVILSVIYSKGLSLDPMKSFVEKKISDNSPGSSLKYNGAILKYNEKNGFYAEVNKLVYLDSNTAHIFDIDSLRVDFDFLSLWNNENKNIQLDLDKLRIVDSESSEIGKFIDLSINIKNENLIRNTEYQREQAKNNHEIKEQILK